jgi:protein TonB
MGFWLFPLSMRRPPRPGPAGRGLVPVHWGLLALVAGAHAAGIGLLAGADAPAPRETSRRAAETMITARLVAPPAADPGKALPAAHPAPELDPPGHPAAEITPAPTAAAGTAPPPRSGPALVPAPKPAAARKRREPPATAARSTPTVTPPAAPAEPAVPQSVTAEPRPSPPPAAALARTPTIVPDVAPAAGGARSAGSGATPGGDGEPTTIAAHYDADYLANPAPAYPAASRRLGEQGTVLLRVQVMRNGRPQAIEVLAGSGSPRLDRAATEAVRRWRFVPATQQGRPVDSWLRVPIVFRLED